MMRLELLKLRRSRRPLMAVLALAIFLAMMLLGFYTYAQKRTGGDVDFRYTFENRSYFNGLTFALYAFYFAFQLVLPIFAATEGGTQLAGESARGTLQLLLTRPLTKTRLFFAKFATASAYTACLAGFFLIVCLGLGLVAVGWGDLDVYPGVLQMTQRHQHLDQSEALVRFGMALPAAVLGLIASVSFGFLLSAWTKNPVNAASSAIALYLVMHVISSVHFFESLRPFLYTSTLGYWRSLFQERIPWIEVGRDAAKLCAFTCLFLALAHARFRMREER